MARKVRHGRSGLHHWQSLVGAVKVMNVLSKNVRIYPPTHSEVHLGIEKLLETLAPVFQDHDDVGFGYIDEVLYIEGAMSIEETRASEALVEMFDKCRVKYMTLAKDISAEELQGLFTALSDGVKNPDGPPIPETLARLGIRNARIVESELGGEHSGKKGRGQTLLEWYDKLVELVGKTHMELRRGGKTDLSALYHVVDDMMATMRTKGAGPYLLLPVAAKPRDAHVGHAVNTAIYCGALADLYGLPAAQTQLLCVGAFLHDIGRCVIPPEIVSNRRKLGEAQRKLIAQYPMWGFLILTRHAELPPPVSLLAAYHRGRPAAEMEKGRYGPDSLHKLLAVAAGYGSARFGDDYYWRRHRPERVLRSMLRRSGRWYDESIVKKFVQVVGLYPVGSLVRLQDGRRGLVVRSDASHVARPKVYLFEESQPTVLDLLELTEDGLGFKNTIASQADPDRGVDVGALIQARQEELFSYAL